MDTPDYQKRLQQQIEQYRHVENSRKENEAGILPAIAQGIRTDELVKKFGLF